MGESSESQHQVDAGAFKAVSQPKLPLNGVQSNACACWAYLRSVSGLDLAKGWGRHAAVAIIAEPDITEYPTRLG